MAEKIIIVGGGFTGLAAALALARADPRPEITLLESGPGLGGLAGGFPVCGTYLEKSYHYLLLGDTEALALARKLGLADKLIYRTGSVAIYDGTAMHPFTTALDLLRFRPLPLPDRLRLGLVMLRLQLMRDWRPLAGETARAWLTRACGPRAMEVVWNPLLRGKFDRHWDRVSMAWLWARIHTRANSRQGGRERLAYFRGGFAQLVDAMEKRLLDEGVTLRTGSPVERIETAPERRVHLHTGETLAFDRCLFTGPSDVFARLLPDQPALAAYRRQLRSVTYLGAICVIIVTDQALGRHHWINIHDPQAPFLVMINHTALTGADLYQGKQVYYLGCYCPQDSRWFSTDDAALLDEWLAYLGRIHPAFDRSRLGEHHVFRFRNAQHVVDCGYEANIPSFRTPLAGVYLANFSQIFPYDRGTNFAIRDGLRLARLVIDDMATGAAGTCPTAERS